MSTPHRRPPTGVRAFFGLLTIAALIFNVALLISDRAPAFTKRVFGGFASRLSERLDANARAEVIRDGGLPEGDAIVHIGVWAVATLLLALTIWTWRGLLMSCIAAFVASIAIELAQGRYSTTRNVELNDVVANAAGVCIGAVLAACCYGAWSAVSGVVQGRRQPRP
jgi:VanZ family protein